VAAANVKHAAMTDERSCLNCHAPHLADHKPLMRRRMDHVCLTCHDKPLEAADGRTVAAMANVLTKSKFLHGAIRAGECSACHDAHGAAEHALLVGAFPDSSYARFDVNKYALCFKSCHSPEIVLTKRTTSLTNFRDGEVNLHYLHVNRDEKGRSCKTCHAIHGSDLPNHMAGEVAFERSGWAMPVGFEKMSNGGSCAPGCHAPKQYDRTRVPTTAPSTRPAIGGLP
jgi:predicted CXXCH cytochrome family protein